MKTFPWHPATMEITAPDGIHLEILKSFRWGPASGEHFDFIGIRDKGDSIRELTIVEVVNDLSGFFEAKTTEGFRIVVRPYDVYDPVRAGISSIPWPKVAIEDYLSGDGEDEMSLVALVDDNGDVASLMLISPSSMHLRYSAQWVLLTDLEIIENYDVVAVADTALDLYDPADQAGESVKILDMPVEAEDDFRVAVSYSGDPGAERMAPIGAAAALTASGAGVPVISSASDLPSAVEFATEHPEFQWYVERRSRAFGLSYEFPWE